MLLLLLITTLQLQSACAEQLVAETGTLVEPYRLYPQLLTLLLGIFRHEQSVGIRRLAVATIGLLGALDPYLFKLYSGIVLCITDPSTVLYEHIVHTHTHSKATTEYNRLRSV